MCVLGAFRRRSTSAILHAMHGPVARTLFTIASFVPLVGVFAISGWIVVTAARGGVQSQDDVAQLALVVIGASTVIAFVQIALGIAVTLHVTKRPDLSSAQRAGWALACLFVGSFALPLFSFLVLPGARRTTGPGASPGR